MLCSKNPDVGDGRQATAILLEGRSGVQTGKSTFTRSLLHFLSKPIKVKRDLKIT